MDAKEPVTVRVGKNGVTAAIIAEVTSVLKKNKVVKVKMLKTSLTEGDKHEMAEGLRKSCKAQKVKLIGHTLTLRI
jgi:putative YhbY family RNA-binding protein